MCDRRVRPTPDSTLDFRALSPSPSLDGCRLLTHPQPSTQVGHPVRTVARRSLGLDPTAAFPATRRDRSHRVGTHGSPHGSAAARIGNGSLDRSTAARRTANDQHLGKRASKRPKPRKPPDRPATLPFAHPAILEGVLRSRLRSKSHCHRHRHRHSYSHCSQQCTRRRRARGRRRWHTATATATATPGRSER